MLHEILLRHGLRDEFFAVSIDLRLQLLGHLGAKFFSKLLEFGSSDVGGEVGEEGSWVQLIHDEVLDVHQHKIESVEVETVLLYNLEHCEGDTEQNTDTLQQKEIPDDQLGLQRDLVHEDLDKPGEREQVCVEVDFLKVAD